MGCNCRNRAQTARARTYLPTSGDGAAGRGGVDATQVFSLILRDGTEQRFGSRLEADAANARAGYSGIVRQNG